MPLKVEIVDREGSLWSGQAEQISVPSVAGDMGILPGHQPALVVLRPGKVRLTPVGDEPTKDFPVERGFSSVDHDSVTVVVRRDLSSKESDLPE